MAVAGKCFSMTTARALSSCDLENVFVFYPLLCSSMSIELQDSNLLYICRSFLYLNFRLS